ncbi:MAG: S-layer homology domain-containing protein [Clostridia bacterium]|nr:S-layer homology domain-containing protein [Clostridia bacterium]
MNKFKTYILLLCYCTMLIFPCMAEASPPNFEVSATADNVDIGDEVYLLVNLNDNAGFGALQFSIEYDEDKLLLENVTTGEIIPEGTISATNTDIIGEINFSAISIQNIEESGTVLVSKFKAKQSGTAIFDFKLQVYADGNGESLNASFNDTEITIESDKPTGSGGSSGGGGSGKPAEKPTEPEKPAEEPTEDAKPTFSDVSESHWAFSQIQKVSEMGIFSGTGEDTFSPNLPMTRAMFVTVLYRFAGSPESEKADFTDVEDSWYTDAVSWAANNNIVAGTGDNQFSPNKNVTRGEISSILCRFKNGKSTDINSINDFNDSGEIPEWGKESIAWAVENGLVMGRDGGLIAFSESASRAEAAVIFTRFLDI